MATHRTRTYTPRMVGETDVAPGVKRARPTDSRRPGILFWSTSESAGEGRITVLACVETMLAMSVTAYIAWRTGSLLYIAVPACVAPLLLLRTPYSTEVGLKLWGRYEALLKSIDTWHGRARESGRFVGLLSLAAYSAVVFCSMLPASVCRIAAVGTAIFRHPITTFGAIPRNWRRVALATDLHHPPEMVPGIEQGDEHVGFRLAPVLRATTRKLNPDLPRRQRVMLSLVHWVVLGVVLVLCFGPALLYRWSLKSTSAVYFPLLWAAFKGRRGENRAAHRVEMITTDQAERIVRWYAWVVLIFLTILPAVLAAPLQPIIARVQSAFGVEVVDFWLFTGQIKLWHVVRVFNAIITVGLFLFADKALRRIKHGDPHSDELVHKIIGTCLFVRGFLGLYLAAKLLHTVITSVDWSAVDWRIVPW